MPAQPPQTPPIISTQSQLQELIDALAVADLVGFDTEFHSERTYVPRLMLLQFATRDGLWLVDPLADLDLKPLVQALQPDVQQSLIGALAAHMTKFVDLPPDAVSIIAVSDASAEVPICSDTVRVRTGASGVELLLVDDSVVIFDTQIAAAFLGHGLQIGLAGLLQAMLGVHQPKGDQMADWSKRPLPERMVGYAAGDVAHLLPLHALLMDELTKLGRADWVLEECATLTDSAPYIRDPDAAFLRVAGGRRMDAREAGIVRALAVEREVIAQEEDIVPHFLLPDEMLHTLARVAPVRRSDLENDRRLSHRTVYRHAQRWLDAVARGLAEPHHRPPGRQPPGWELEAVAALMMLLVNDIAVKQNLAPQLLVKREALLNAVREPLDSPDALAAALGLTGWRAELLVEPLWALLDGQVAVRCQRQQNGALHLRFLE